MKIINIITRKKHSSCISPPTYRYHQSYCKHIILNHEDNRPKYSSIYGRLVSITGRGLGCIADDDDGTNIVFDETTHGRRCGKIRQTSIGRRIGKDVNGMGSTVGDRCLCHVVSTIFCFFRLIVCSFVRDSVCMVSLRPGGADNNLVNGLKQTTGL